MNGARSTTVGSCARLGRVTTRLYEIRFSGNNDIDGAVLHCSSYDYNFFSPSPYRYLLALWLDYTPLCTGGCITRGHHVPGRGGGCNFPEDPPRRSARIKINNVRRLFNYIVPPPPVQIAYATVSAAVAVACADTSDDHRWWSVVGAFRRGLRVIRDPVVLPVERTAAGAV